MRSPSPDPRQEIIGRQIAAAIARHRDQAAFVRLVAAELPPKEQPPWLAVADALATGDVARGTAAASASLGSWLPLIASPAGDPRLPARILDTAGQLPQAPEARWHLFAYPLALVVFALGLLGLLSATVLTVFEKLFEEFGMQLPLITRAALAIRPFMASVWGPLVLAAGLVIVARWLLARWSAGGSAITAAFTRSLARLVAADVPTDEAIVMAEQVVHARSLDLAAPRRPLTYAAAAALDFAPRPAAILLDAVAACHEDRRRGSISVGQWFVGPALIVTVGLLVGFVALALFWPLLNLVGVLS
jgi:hypothetical protein